ncbi:MAG TPA: glycoside hydrolase family 15 protein [bacterium]|nr:glycoside hydrolase family 15 protein [bacterium]
MSYQPIEHHGVIGDLHTIALVTMEGSIDFMCYPEFDSPTIFAALLDDHRGGRFQIAPLLSNARRKQVYLPDSNVLLTRFLSQEGVAEISDFMPVEETGRAHALIRRAKTVRGEIQYRVVCAPRFDYARTPHRTESRGADILFVPEGGTQPTLRLRSGIPVRLVEGQAMAEFTLRTGETAEFILDAAPAGEASAADTPGYVSRSFKDTLNFWRRWIGRSTYQGRWREMVNRSALILKLLTSQPHGAIVAAPTFGLPERIGGEWNWDYRYTWIRDASFTLYALFRLGYTGEAASFMRWIEARCAERHADGSLQTIYGIDGRHDLPEHTLSHLEGYLGSSPVRIGNAASTQLQLDIYGELLDSVYLYNKYGEPISSKLWEDLIQLINWVCRHWREADAGVWEVRGTPREFLYSRLLCWVALDRGIRLAQKRSFPSPLTEWHGVRDEIYRAIYEHFWNPHRTAFVQYKGATTMDASSLLMPLVRFVAPTDPRWLSTLRAIEHDLVEDSLVYRYRVGAGAPDGLSGREGSFCMCSFWYAECLSRAGDLEKARFVLEKMLGYANHLGLYAEQLGPCGEHLGNFPQAFTHLALISAAFDLDRRLNHQRQQP